jgi:hypothetical protein
MDARIYRGTKPLIISGTLTQAQINNLGTSPVTLIPAPGAGKFIIVQRITLIFNAGSVGFSNDNLAISYANNPSALLFSNTTEGLGWTTTTSNFYDSIITNEDATLIATNYTLAQAVNNPVQLGPFGPVPTGGTGCTITYYLYYTIMSTS